MKRSRPSAKATSMILAVLIALSCSVVPRSVAANGDESGRFRLRLFDQESLNDPTRRLAPEGKLPTSDKFNSTSLVEASEALPDAKNETSPAGAATDVKTKDDPLPTKNTTLADKEKTVTFPDQEEEEDEQTLEPTWDYSMSMSMYFSYSKEGKNSKNAKKGTKAPKSTFSPTYQASEGDTYSPGDSFTISPTSQGSKGSKTSKNAKASKKGDNVYNGYYVKLREFKKSCSSSGGCIKAKKAFCMGGMDVVQEFSLEGLGTVKVHLDITWDFAGAPSGSTCGTISKGKETLWGLGWLPIIMTNSYICFVDYVYRIPESPNLNEQDFAGTFSVEMPDGEHLDGQILSGSVCEVYSDQGTYLQTTSFTILAMIPGYSVSLHYLMDERTMQVMESLSGAPHITIMDDDSLNSGRWDHLKPDIALMKGT